MVMLTADGTRESARAAAENEPRSSTAKNTCTLSEEKAMVAIIKKTETSGKIEIEYYSLDDLERIYELLEEKAQALGGSLKKIQKLNV